jgi:hypothetical protein
MHRFTAACVGLIRSFFTWHCFKFLFRTHLTDKLLQNIFSIIHRGTIPVDCERTAKVRVLAQIGKVFGDFRLPILDWRPLMADE